MVMMYRHNSNSTLLGDINPKFIKILQPFYVYSIYYFRIKFVWSVISNKRSECFWNGFLLLLTVHILYCVKSQNNLRPLVNFMRYCYVNTLQGDLLPEPVTSSVDHNFIDRV